MEKVNTDHWSADGAFFFCDNLKYGITPAGTTICFGLGKPPDITDKPPSGQDSVTKPPDKGIVPIKQSHAQEPEVLLHKNKGGRPRKPEGEAVTRMTRWRRAKELQGTLL